MYNIRRKVVNGVLSIFLLALADGAIADIKKTVIKVAMMQILARNTFGLGL